MRITSWASTVLIACLSVSSVAADVSLVLSSGGTIGYTTVRGKTRLEIRTSKGAHYILSVKRDATVSPTSDPSQLTLVGEIPGKAIILIDAYPSIPGGMSYCQAGEERFLRVVSMAKHPAVETFRIKLESCRENIELSSPGVEWNPEASRLSIHWLQGPDKTQKPAELILNVGAEGRPE